MKKKTLWLVGTGASCKTYSKYVKRLAGKDTLALHRAYPYCVEHFGFHPTYWTWLDPDAAMDGLKYLAKQKTPPKTTILLPYPQLESKKKEEFIRTTGTSVLSRSDKSWNQYMSLLKQVEKLGTKVKRINALPLKQLIAEQGKHPDLFAHTDDPKHRFSGKQIIIGSDYEPGKKSPLLESKLTSLVLPLGVHLGYNRFFVVGFDYQGGRFYREKHLIKQNPNYHEDLLEKWKAWGKQVGFEIVSAVEDQNTKTNKYIDFLHIRKAVKAPEHS